MAGEPRQAGQVAHSLLGTMPASESPLAAGPGPSARPASHPPTHGPPAPPHLHPDLPNVSWCTLVKQFFSLEYCRMTMRPESLPQIT